MKSLQIAETLSVKQDKTRIRIYKMNPVDRSFNVVTIHDSQDARAIAQELLKWADEYDTP